MENKTEKEKSNLATNCKRKRLNLQHVQKKLSRTGTRTKPKCQINVTKIKVLTYNNSPLGEAIIATCRSLKSQ